MNTQEEQSHSIEKRENYESYGSNMLQGIGCDLFKYSAGMENIDSLNSDDVKKCINFFTTHGYEVVDTMSHNRSEIIQLQKGDACYYLKIPGDTMGIKSEYLMLKLMGLFGLSTPKIVGYRDNAYIITSEIKNTSTNKYSGIKYDDISFARHFVVLWMLGIADIVYIKNHCIPFIGKNNIRCTTTGSGKGIKNVGFDPLEVNN